MATESARFAHLFSPLKAGYDGAARRLHLATGFQGTQLKR
jgi:hypothetical protein